MSLIVFVFTSKRSVQPRDHHRFAEHGPAHVVVVVAVGAVVVVVDTRRMFAAESEVVLVVAEEHYIPLLPVHRSPVASVLADQAGTHCMSLGVARSTVLAGVLVERTREHTCWGCIRRLQSVHAVAAVGRACPESLTVEGILDVETRIVGSQDWVQECAFRNLASPGVK